MRGEARTVLTVLAIIGLAEVALRRYQSTLSGDVEHLQQAPAIVEDAARGPGLNVLLWGNSLIAAGVDPEQLGRAMNAARADSVSIGMVRPDGTGPLEWRYLLRRTALNERLPIDAVVLGVGPGHLIDRVTSRFTAGLAAHHVAGRDIPELFEVDVRGLEERASFALSRLIAAYSMRDRIRDRLLDEIVPDYRVLARELRRTPLPADSTVQPRFTYEQFGRFVDDISESGILLVAVLMPAPQPWTLAPAVASELERVEAIVVDVREQAVLPLERYPDGEHLDLAGRQIFTDALAPALIAVLDSALPAGPR